MNDTHSKELLNYILAQAPVLLASLCGLIVALRLWRKAPAASLWAVTAFALGIFTSGLVGVGQAVGSDAATHFVGPALRAATYVLLLIGVYAGRTRPSATLTGPPESVWQNVVLTMRGRPGLLAVSRVLFVGVFLVVVIATTLVTFILPESFVSQARIALRPGTSNAPGTTSPQGAASGFDPHFIQTECEVIQSEAILGKAIDDLDLNKEFGKKYANGDRLKTSETMMLLRGRLDLRPVPNTSIIEIRSYSEKPEEAATVANAIAEAYRDHINSPDSAASTSRRARAELIGMAIHTSAPAPADTAISRPGGLRVEIIDRAVPSLMPISPNKPLNITLGVMTGLVLGLLVVAGTWWIGLQAGKRPVANLQS